ncbi:hypothetical protein ACFLYU_04760, partial [Candidatus Dependentiae bacterium]
PSEFRRRIKEKQSMLKVLERKLEKIKNKKREIRNLSIESVESSRGSFDYSFCSLSKPYRMFLFIFKDKDKEDFSFEYEKDKDISFELVKGKLVTIPVGDEKKKPDFVKKIIDDTKYPGLLWASKLLMACGNKEKTLFKLGDISSSKSKIKRYSDIKIKTYS